MIALIPLLSLLPARFFKHIAGPHPPPGVDKIVHALLYAALASALFHTLSTVNKTRYSYALRITLAATCYGLVMEICQRFLTHSRSFDPFDALANAFGAFAVAFMACAYVRKRVRDSADRQTRSSTLS